MRKYLDAEHTVKKGKPFDFEGWEDAFNSVSAAGSGPPRKQVLTTYPGLAAAGQWLRLRHLHVPDPRGTRARTGPDRRRVRVHVAEHAVLQAVDDVGDCKGRAGQAVVGRRRGATARQGIGLGCMNASMCQSAESVGANQRVRMDPRRKRG